MGRHRGQSRQGERCVWPPRGRPSTASPGSLPSSWPSGTSQPHNKHREASDWKGDFEKIVNLSGPQGAPSSNGDDIILGLLMAPCPQAVVLVAPGGGRYVRAPHLTHLWAPPAQGPWTEKGGRPSGT